MSWRLRAATWLMRALVKPQLRRTRTPEEAAADFLRGSRHFRPPPHLLRLERPLGGVRAHWISAGPVAPGRVVLWLHGGAFLSGSGQTHAPFLARLSRLAGVEVAAPDYRLLQEAPFPAAFEDARAAWEGLRALGYRPGDVALGGDSAGGGLAAALLAHLLARGQRPAAVVLVSPWMDLTLSGASLGTLGPRDALIPVGRMREVVERYLAGADPTDPRASPLFAAFPDPPPALVQVGTGEALRSDAEAAAALLGARLSLLPGAPHVIHVLDGWVPEARAAVREAAGFVRGAWGPRAA